MVLFKSSIKKILVKYLTSYVVVLMIPIIVSMVIYKESLDLLAKDAMDANMEVLEQTKDVLDRRMMELDSIAWNIMMNNTVSLLLYSPSQTTENVTNAFNTMKKDFYTYKVSNNFISNYFVYFKYADSVATPDGIYSPRDYYDAFQRSNTNWQTDYESWYSFMKGGFDQEKTVMTLKPGKGVGKEGNIIYIYKLPVYGTNLNLGTLGIIASNEQLNSIMEHTTDENGGSFYILDDGGKVVTSAGKDKNRYEAYLPRFDNEKGMSVEKINGHKVLVTYIKSSGFGWRYMLIVPQKLVMAGTNRIVTLMLFIILLCLVLGVAVSAAFAYKNSKPLEHLVDDITERLKFTDVVPENDTFGFIKNAFMKLFIESRNQKDIINRQIPILADNFFTKLIKGEIQSDDEIKRYEALLGLKLDAASFSIMLFYVERFKEIEISGLMVINEIKQLSIENGYAFSVDEKTTGLLIGFGSEDHSYSIDKVKKMAASVRDILFIKYEIPVITAIGGIYAGTSEIYRSYEDAAEALRLGQLKGDNGIIMYEDIAAGQGADYYYPPEEETRLMNSVRAGNLDMVNTVLDTVMNENFSRRCLRPAIVECLLNDIKSTFIKLLPEMRILDSTGNSFEAAAAEIKKGKNEVETFNHLRKLFVDVCNMVNSKKKSHNDLLKESIKAYIAENYTSQLLSLASVAEHFNISEPYLSKFFSQHMGENFSVYLSRLRVEKAESLLRESRLTIEQISSDIGFGSVHVFIKVFKKYTGLTPGMYKNTFKSYSGY